MAKRDSDGLSRFLIAVSNTSNPGGWWCNFWTNARLNGSTDSGLWADYEKAGITNNAVVLSANMVAFGGSLQYSKLRIFYKSIFYDTS